MTTRQYAHINPDLLVWARESIKMALEDAAQALKIEAEHLTEWEKGEVLPTIPQLREAAKVYRRPLAAFFLPEPPKDFHVPHDFRRLPGEPSPHLSPELITELRRAQFRRQLAIEVAEEIIELPKKFIGSIKLSSNVDAAADKTRVLLGVTLEEQERFKSSYEAFNRWRNAVEGIGVIVFLFGDVDLDEVRGFSISEYPFPIIGINAKDMPNGRIFTLIHEFGHLLLNQGGSCNLREYKPVHSANQRVEVFCNFLAGAVLVPDEALNHDKQVSESDQSTTWNDDDLRRLAEAFCVSREVILRRLLILHRTNQAFYQARQKEWKQAAQEITAKGGGFLSVPKKVVRNVGRSFARLVFAAYNREMITSSDVAEYLGVRAKHFAEIEQLAYGPMEIAQGED